MYLHTFLATGTIAIYELDFLRPGDGNGGAICVRHGSEQRGGYWLHVVDGGFSDTADVVIAHIEDHYGRHYHINREKFNPLRRGKGSNWAQWRK